jgi:hypothetical protein
LISANYGLIQANPLIPFPSLLSLLHVDHGS